MLLKFFLVWLILFSGCCSEAILFPQHTLVTVKPNCRVSVNLKFSGDDWGFHFIVILCNVFRISHVVLGMLKTSVALTFVMYILGSHVPCERPMVEPLF